MAKPKIFLYCVPINEGVFNGDVMGYALAEDGTELCSHLSSDKYFSKHDMGLTCNWHHDTYQEHYSDGFELVWLDAPENNEDFKKALKLNEKVGDIEENKPSITIEVE